MKETIKTSIDTAQVRRDFPILHQQVEGRPLVYFDNAATTQKPSCVIEAISDYYHTINSNVHRGVHYLSQKSTDAFEQGRAAVQRHLNAAHPHEVLFTGGVTDSINTVAGALGKGIIGKKDEIIVSELEHHSNIVPWQMLCEQTGAQLKVIPVNDAGELMMDKYHELLSERTRIVAVNHVSNALGTINPVKEIIAAAHQYGAWVLIDGAQSIPHMKVDVQELDADFYTFSSHKVFGPTGLGVLYGKEAILEELPPYRGGGEMIKEVRFEKTTYGGLPHKFEAGTPHIEAGVVLARALEYIQNLGLDAITLYEKELLDYATEQMVHQFPDIQLIGTAREKTGALSFLLPDIHPYDLGVLMDKMGIALRTGHHCTQPLMHRFGITGTIRASFAFYNTFEEVDRMVEALAKAKSMLS